MGVTSSNRPGHPASNGTNLRRKFIALLAAFMLYAVPFSAQQAAQVTTVHDEPTIAGRPVHLDAHGKLLPWPMPDNTGYSYSSYFLSQWTIVWDQFQRQRLLYQYWCFDFDRTTFELTPDKNWANSTGYLRAMMQGFIERLYPYTGDPRTLEFLTNFVDYELEHGLTPENYAWSRVPYPSANPGAKNYSGWSNHGEDFIEPHVVGEDGYAYLRLYEMTGNKKYLLAAIRCADALVKNFKPGDAENSPWPYRCFAKDGSLHNGKGDGMFPYSANIVEPIMLFDELIRLKEGDSASYTKIRAGAWDWLMKYPMQNNQWVGYFEDVKASMGDKNQVIPLEFARYVLLHPEKDPQWREHSAKLIDWVKTTPDWPKYLVHGATVTTEQGSNLKDFCCNLPNQCCDSHSARLAAVEALYYAKTGDAAYKEAAYRTYNWVTYWQGLPGAAHAPFSNQWWFTDEFADGPRRMMDAFWAIPEWAPTDESHLLGSSSPVTKISYGRGSVTYSTFDSDSTDVLRLSFTPDAVTSNGHPLSRQKNLAIASGYNFDERTHVLRIHHTTSGDVDIRGKSDIIPPFFVTFDAPHWAVGTVLNGEYPPGLIDWPADQWSITAPGGKFGTFNLTAQSSANNPSLKFASAKIFLGIDINNEGSRPVTVSISTAEPAEQISITLQPNEIRRVRTSWLKPTREVHFELHNAAHLRFDNLAYAAP